MFVIIVEKNGEKALLYDGRSVFTTESQWVGEGILECYSELNTDHNVSYTLCRVTPMPQEGP